MIIIFNRLMIFQSTQIFLNKIAMLSKFPILLIDVNLHLLKIVNLKS